MASHSKQRGKRFFVQSAADDAHASGHAGAAAAQLGLAGHMVEMQPFAVAAVHDALCAQYGAVGIRIVERGEDLLQLGFAEFFAVSTPQLTKTSSASW